MSALWLGVLAHLWQTTLVLLVFGALALLLRRAPARYQEWLWTAALLKLLVPLPVVALVWPALTRFGSAAGQQETIGPAIKTLSQLANPRVLWAPPVDATGAGSLQPMLAAATIGWGLGAVALLMFWYKRGRVSIPAGRMPWHASATFGVRWSWSRPLWSRTSAEKSCAPCCCTRMPIGAAATAGGARRTVLPPVCSFSIRRPGG